MNLYCPECKKLSVPLGQLMKCENCGYVFMDEKK